MIKIVTAAIAASLLIAAPVSLQAQTTTPAATEKPAKTAKPKREMSPGQAAMRERQKKCGAQWKEDKAAGKVAKGQTWPKYWSACNKRLKAAG